MRARTRDNADRARTYTVAYVAVRPPPIRRFKRKPASKRSRTSRGITLPQRHARRRRSRHPRLFKIVAHGRKYRINSRCPSHHTYRVHRPSSFSRSSSSKVVVLLRCRFRNEYRSIAACVATPTRSPPDDVDVDDARDELGRSDAVTTYPPPSRATVVRGSRR